MTGPVLSVPAKRASGWFAETDPKYARAWIDSLPLADSGEAARELYQALYTLNRLSLPVGQRIDLMALYENPVATVSAALQTHLARVAQPLSPKKRQLAEFVRHLQIEVAYGYKCCLQDLSSARLLWGRGALLARVAERALHYLREVLIRSYQVYMPYPTGIWNEIHEIYRFAEGRDIEADAVEIQTDGASRTTALTERYLQILLLGVSQPYQLPQGMCAQLCAFLDAWGGRAQLSKAVSIANPAAQFVVDLAADGPPIPFPRGQSMDAAPTLRILNAMELVRLAQNFIGRLKKGEPVTALALGVDSLEETCLDLLQRMVSIWGLTPQRRYKRIRRNSYVSVCSGVNALHFFANGQAPFVAPGTEASRTMGKSGRGDDFLEMDSSGHHVTQDSGPVSTLSKTRRGRAAPTSFRVDRWHVRDAGPHGMLLARYGEMAMSARVGDVLGLQEVSGGQWNPAVVRWLKSPESQSLELGVELLAAKAAPVAVRGSSEDADYVEALLLPATTTPRRPATLLAPRGMFAARGNLFLLEPGRPPRPIRPVKLIERTISYERFVFADVLSSFAP